MSPDTEIAPTVRLECAAVGRVRAHEYQVSSEAAIRAAEANVSVQPEADLASRVAVLQRLLPVMSLPMSSRSGTHSGHSCACDISDPVADFKVLLTWANSA